MCVGNLTMIGSDNGSWLSRCQVIIRTNVGILLTGALRTNFTEILIEIIKFLFNKMRLKVSSAKRRPFCLGINVLSKDGFYPCSLGSCIIATVLMRQPLRNVSCMSSVSTNAAFQESLFEVRKLCRLYQSTSTIQRKTFSVDTYLPKGVETLLQNNCDLMCIQVNDILIRSWQYWMCYARYI